MRCCINDAVGTLPLLVCGCVLDHITVVDNDRTGVGADENPPNTTPAHKLPEGIVICSYNASGHPVWSVLDRLWVYLGAQLQSCLSVGNFFRLHYSLSDIHLSNSVCCHTHSGVVMRSGASVLLCVLPVCFGCNLRLSN